MQDLGMKDGYRLRSQFLSGEETDRWRQTVGSRRDIFRAVGGRGGLNLPYSVIDGRRCREHFPELVELVCTRLRAAAEETVGRPLVPIQDEKRSLRIQLYGGRQEGFRWHLDVSPYSALLTLENSSRGATEVIPPRLTRLLMPLYYPFYPLRQIFSALPHRTIHSAPGDLLILHGGAVLHRARALADEGERLVVVAVFEPAGSKPTPIRNWLARNFNY
jgi:hypothetical protein